VSINPVDVRYYANDLVASQSSGGASMSWRGVTTITPGAVSPGGYNDPDEFGNARNSAETRTGPADGTSSGRYDWLGGKQRSSDALAGTVLMGVRLYTPALGRFLQTDPVPGGSDNAYDYAGQDPVNTYDLDGRFSIKRFYKKHHKAIWGGVKLAVGAAALFTCPICAGLAYASLAWSAADTAAAARRGGWRAAAGEAVSFIPIGGRGATVAYRGFASAGIARSYATRAPRAVRQAYRSHLARSYRIERHARMVDFGAWTYDAVRYGRSLG